MNPNILYISTVLAAGGARQSLQSESEKVFLQLKIYKVFYDK